MKIKYLKNQQIDQKKWDEIINVSPQGKVYAYSWFLNCMSPGWDALVAEDYTAVFPLPWTETIPGIKRIFQPRVCQQLGLFLKEGEVSQDLLHEFLNNIPAHFKSVELLLNEDNPKPDLKQWKISRRVNMILPLNDDYKTIEAGYSENHKRNVRKSNGADLVPGDMLTSKDFVEAFLDTFKGKIRNYTENQKKGLISLINISINSKAGFIRVWSDRLGNILSAAFFLKSQNRIYYVLPFSTAKGRKMGGMYKLLDTLIWENVGTSTIFDFEGSSIPGIASFNLGFGAKEQTFYAVSKNNLPIWYKLLLTIKSKFKKIFHIK